MSDELMLKVARVYSMLSPENLYCDGEVSHASAKRSAAILKRDLKDLFRELGREVSEDEADAYLEQWNLDHPTRQY